MPCCEQPFGGYREVYHRRAFFVKKPSRRYKKFEFFHKFNQEVINTLLRNVHRLFPSVLGGRKSSRSSEIEISCETEVPSRLGVIRVLV